MAAAADAPASAFGELQVRLVSSAKCSAVPAGIAAVSQADRANRRLTAGAALETAPEFSPQNDQAQWVEYRPDTDAAQLV